MIIGEGQNIKADLWKLFGDFLRRIKGIVTACDSQLTAAEHNLLIPDDKIAVQIGGYLVKIVFKDASLSHPVV